MLRKCTQNIGMLRTEFGVKFQGFEQSFSTISALNLDSYDLPADRFPKAVNLYAIYLRFGQCLHVPKTLLA
jgi:hypothetical protein